MILTIFRVTKAQIGQARDDINLLNNECGLLNYEIHVCYRINLLSKYDDLLEGLEEAHYKIDKLKHRYQIEKRRVREERQKEISIF